MNVLKQNKLKKGQVMKAQQQVFQQGDKVEWRATLTIKGQFRGYLNEDTAVVLMDSGYQTTAPLNEIHKVEE